MISVVIATLNDERTLGEVMGALVAAAVDALVREVIVVDAGSTDHTLEIADDAGARILKASGPDAVAQGCATAKGDWLLILDPKAPVPDGWEKAVAEHIRLHGGQAGWWSARSGWFGGGKPQAVLMPKSLFSGVLGKRGRRIRIGR
jgi:glycosyltransferase involved in cell wall biosynthesis